MLAEQGARVVICDINESRVQELREKHGFEAVPDDQHLEVECDIYSPCARGATINDETIPRLRCKAVAGCANNQLLEPRHARDLRARGILYAPDYVINAGGIINVSVELLPEGYVETTSLSKIDRIYDHLKTVFEISRVESIPTNEAAARLAEKRLAAGREKKTRARVRVDVAPSTLRGLRSVRRPRALGQRGAVRGSGRCSRLPRHGDVFENVRVAS
jgi:leucine dehydrogenase